jgi:dipeptidase E
MRSLSNVDVIFVSGGNVFYLLARKNGFNIVVKDLIEKGIIYIGSSAGSCNAGPNIKPIELLDEPEKAKDLDRTEAFNLVDFVILPHFGKEKYQSQFNQIEDKYDNEYKLV